MRTLSLRLAFGAVLLSWTSVFGYGGQEKDEAVVRQAIEEGLIDAHSFPLEGRIWEDWVNNCGNFLSYRSNCIKRWEEVAEATDMTPKQRAEAKALHGKYQRIHHRFDETTTPVRDKLGDRRDRAKKAGNEELAEKLNRLRHVQTHQKLAIEGAASEDLLRLLAPEQLKAWHEYRVTKHAVKKMSERIYNREADGKKLADLVDLTAEQKARIERMAWELARDEFLPTVEHPEEISAFAIYGEDEKRAKAMADKKLYPRVHEEVLTEEQRAILGVARPLQLELCAIELVDGRKVEGHLAVQFEMDDHLVVYSPRLATVRSFLKRHVHALTVAGKREVLNEKRPLTEEDRKLLGRVKWPDEPPAEGHKPAYTTETWGRPKRLMVWGSPGRSGRLRDTSRWLANGKPVDSLPRTVIWSGPTWNRTKRLGEFDEETDILIPAADEDYSVRGGAHWHQSKGFLARHLTVEPGGSFQANVKGLFGNLWVSAHSDFYGGGCAYFRGTRHTFIRNGEPRSLDEPIRWATLEAKSLARKWVLRKEDPAASMEIIGGAGSGDETHVQAGRLIVSEGSTVLIGPRCCQSVSPIGVLQLQSGAVFAKNSNQPHKQDMLVRGRLLAGTPQRPITKDCYVGLSFKDHGRLFASEQWQRRGDYRGLEIWPRAVVRVHSTDPTRARLVFCYHGKDGFGDTGAPPKEGEPKYEAYLAIPRRIDITIWAGADVRLDGVLFDDVLRGGIRLGDPEMRTEWRNVFFGDGNGGQPEELFARFTPSEENRKRVEAKSGPDGAVDRFFGVPLYVRDAQPTWEARIDPMGGQFPAGEAVTVILKLATNQRDLKGVELRYTLDGSEPESESKRYAGPFKLRSATTVKARCFRDGEALRGDAAEATFEFVRPRKADAPGDTQPGLRYRYYKGTWRDQPDFEKGSPLEEGVIRRIVPEIRPEGRSTVVLFSGYLEAPRQGVYRFHPTPTNSCRITIGDRVVWDPGPLHPECQKDELVFLSAGKHRFQAAYFFGEGVDEGELGFAWEGPGIDRQPIPAEALSH